MEKIVALCKRRGFVFPSSEIYGGVGSTYDFGHYGVLLKSNVKNEWWRAMIRSATTSSRSTPRSCSTRACGRPRATSKASPTRSSTARRAGSASAPTTSQSSPCGRKPSKHPGETDECELTEARDFNLMFETTIGPVKESGSTAYLRPETAQGIFINFKNVLQFSRKKPPFGIAQVGKSFRNEITPGNFIFRTREFEQMEMEFFVPPERGAAVVRALARRARALVHGARHPPRPPAPARPRRRRALALLLGHERRRIPLPDRLVGARGDRQPRRLRPHAPRRVLRREARVLRPGERRALRAARDRAGRRRRPRDARVPRRRLRRGSRRGEGAGRRASSARVLRLHPRLAPVKAAILPLRAKDGQPELAHEVHRALRARVQAEYDEGGSIGKRYRRQDEIGTPFCLTSTTRASRTERSRCAIATRSRRSASPIEGIAEEIERRVTAPWTTTKAEDPGTARHDRRGWISN